MDWTVVGLVFGLLTLDLLFHLCCVPLILPIFERKPPFGVEPTPPNPQAEPVSFPTKEGLTLRGSLFKQPEQPSRGLIVFAPELGGNHWSVQSYAAGLRDAGFDLLSFDFRNQGDSDSMEGYDPLHWLTEYEVDDLLSAIAYARGRSDLQHSPLGLFGISRGGAATLAAAARCPDVACVACEGAFSTDRMLLHYTLRWASLYVPRWLLRLIPLWHVRITLRLVRWISQVRRRCRYTDLDRLLPRLRRMPVKLIAGGRDTYVPVEITRRMCQRTGQGCCDVWVVDKAKHNMARQVDPETYDRTLVEFFSEHLSELTKSTIAQRPIQPSNHPSEVLPN